MLSHRIWKEILQIESDSAYRFIEIDIACRLNPEGYIQIKGPFVKMATLTGN